MIYLKRNQINDASWNVCINNSNPSFLQAFTWYLDVICQNWDALVLEENGVYLACFPIPWKKKAGLKYVYPPYFAQQLGVFSSSPINPFPFLEKLKEHFKFIELYLNYFGTPSGQEKCNLILPLNETYTELSACFSNNHKRNIQKSEKSGFFLKESNKINDIDLIIELFKQNRGKSIQNLKENDYLIFKNCCKLVSEKEKLKIILAFNKENELIAGAIFFIHQKRITFVFSGVSEQGKMDRALFKIINSILIQYQNSDCILDFEGSENPGIKNFYQGFGAQQQNYYFFKSNRLPFPLNRLKK